MTRKKLQAPLVSVLILSFFASTAAVEITDRHANSAANESLLHMEGLHRQKRVFPIKGSGAATETGIYHLNVNMPTSALYGMIFGHLLLKDETRRTDLDYQCEGVLIGPRHVLSVFPECYPAPAGFMMKSHTNPVTPGEMVVYQYTKKVVNAAQKFTVDVESMWRTGSSKYVVARLAHSVDLTAIPKDRFPFLSWTKQPDAYNYGLYLETAKNYPVLLSTPTATQSLTTFDFNQHLRRFLERSNYNDDPEAIRLVRGGRVNPKGDLDANQKVGGEARPLNGAAFFKPTGDTVALIGLHSDEWTTICGSKLPVLSLKAGSKRKPPADTFHCGYRLDYNTVQDLYHMGLAAQEGLPRDSDTVIRRPLNSRDQTVIGSWNMNFIRKLDNEKALSGEVLKSLKKVIEYTDILALQEVYGFRKAFTGANPPNAISGLGNGQIAYKAAMTGEFAFVYNPTKVQVVGGATATECGDLEVPGHKYARWCKFQFSGKAECITVYTAHFRYSEGNPADRALEFRHFRQQVVLKRRAGAADCGRVQILAGDFNLQNAKEVIDVAENFVDFRFQDAGPTTPSAKKSNYDHILVSETLRMPHHYVFPKLQQGGRGPMESNELERPYGESFYTTDNTALPQLRGREPAVRSYQLSDHLPVQVQWQGMAIGTWNMEDHRPTLKTQYAAQYTSVLSLFKVLAVQELLVVPTPNLYGREWVYSRVLNGERLGFAYDPNAVTVLGCSEIDISGIYQRNGFACVFDTVPAGSRLTAVSLHLLNSPDGGSKPDVNNVKLIIDHIRGLTTTTNIANAGSPINQMWDQAYIMGDFNVDDFRKKWTANPAQKCTHTRYLGAAPWTFTRVLSKRTLDYIFKATALASDVPGDLNCKVIHPELESVGGSHLINDHSSNQAYSFIGSWKELSDHYPVFMKFDHPTEPAGNEAAKRIALGVNQLWP